MLRNNQGRREIMPELIPKIINWSIISAFVICFSYQAIYFFVRYKRKIAIPSTDRKGRYAVLIAARNEENVIGGLIDSIYAQNYPKDLLDIYVVADNCTDRTENIVRWKGVSCYVRHNREKIGKGYALEYLLERLAEEGKLARYDGYFIFDADNILAKNYVEEMNRVFCAGYQVVTSYRNSRNFGANWISFGYGLWFLHEAEFLNKGRMTYGSSCMVSGTGYLISSDIIVRNNGWKHFLLTEDIEFTADCILHDVKIGYCPTAEFFDEQPTRLIDSWNQRIRWVKGYYQVFGKYGGALVKKLLRERKFSCYDMLMGYLPAFVLTAAASLIGISELVIMLFTSHDPGFILFSISMFFLNTFMAMFLLGTYTMVTQWKKIAVNPVRKLLYLLCFPFYMYTYFPIAIAAMKPRVEWKPVRHGQERTARTLRGAAGWKEHLLRNH